MIRIAVFLQTFFADRRGISAMEYAILLGVVGVGLAFALGDVEKSIDKFLSTSVTDVQSAAKASKAVAK